MRKLFYIFLLSLASISGFSQNTEFDDTAFIFDENFTPASAPAGQTYLENTAEVYYDFTALTGADASAISNGNAGLVDYSGNGFTATILNAPTVRDITVGSTVKTLGAAGDNAVTTGSDGTSWFASDFKVYIAFQIEDGQPASGNHYFAGVLATPATSIFQFYLAGGTSNELQIRYRTPTADSRWDSNNTALLPDGVNGVHVLEIEYDFTNDQIGVFLDESPVSGAFISGSMAALNPADFDPDINFAVGTSNLQGTIASNATTCSILRFAVTPLNTAQQTSDVNDFFNFSATGTGVGFNKWVVHQTAGFSATSSNDSLILSGQPVGFEDYVYNIDFIPDSLGELTGRAVVTIDDDLVNGDWGVGVGLINDLTTEANRGVIGLFVTNPASGNFGRVQLYSGDGTVSPTAFALRDQSGGTFVPAKDSSYLFTLERDIQGNDVFYSFTVMDLWDSVSHTTGWIELNRTSDAYYGSTMRAIISQNGGPFRIKPFTIHRTGFESGGGGEPPPPPLAADVFVQLTGSDVNDCTETEPCRTVNRGFIRVQELGPGVQDMFIGAGTFTETSYLNPPNNLGICQGAGRDVTIIAGSPGLYTSTSVSGRSSQNNFLFNLTTGTPVSVGMEFRDFTIDGNKQSGGTTNSIRGGFAIRNKNGIVIDNVGIRYFNTSGMRIWDTDVLTVKNFYIRESSGQETSFTHYQLEFGSALTTGVGGSTVLYTNPTPTPGGSYNVVFEDGLIDANVSGEGAGWGFKGGSGVNRYVFNTRMSRVAFNIYPFAANPTFSNHHFNVELINAKMGNVLLEDCVFNKNLSFASRGLANTPGYTRITGCTFTFPVPSTFAVEMQISKIELDHNLLLNVQNGVFASLNDQDTYTGGGGAPEFKEDHGDWWIHHNILELFTASTSGYGIFGGRAWELKGALFEQNTIRFTTTSTGLWLGMFVDQDAGSSVTGLIIQNNAYVNQPSATTTMWYSGNISGGIMRNNEATHFNVNQSKTGVTSTANFVRGSGNSLGLTLGTPPTTWAEAFTGNYYKPAPGSVLINSGFGGLTIGAREED